MPLRLLGFVGLFAALCVAPVEAQTPPASTGRFPKLTVTGSGSTGDVSGMSVTATGGSASRTQAMRAGDVVNVADYGAKCDGSTNDAPAFNAAFDAIRARTAQGGASSFPIGRSARLTAPSGRCIIASTINATGLFGAGFVWDGHGTTLIGKTNGTPVVDATGMGMAGLLGLTIYGDASAAPNIGLKIGRVTNTNNIGADSLSIERPTITGTFTLAPFHNLESETTTVSYARFLNSAPNAYGAIWDGGNHFNVQSAFTGQTYAQDAMKSFNENTCLGCYIGVTGSGSTPIWIGGSYRHKFIGGYAFYSGAVGSTPGPAVKLYFGNGRINDFLDLDIHFEDFGGNQSLSSLIEFSGAPSVTTRAFKLSDFYPQQNGPIFKRASGTNTVTIEDADIKIGIMAGASPSWWDLPSAYTVGGAIYAQNGALYTAPSTFTGRACLGVNCTVTYSLPSNLTAGSISNPGGVASINRTAGGTYQNGALVQVAIAAPPVGGQQASAHVGSYVLLGFGTISGGSGYAVNDILTLQGGTPLTTPITIKVTAVSGGAITGFIYNGPTGGYYTALPSAGTIALSGGSGTGAFFTGTVWSVFDIVVDSAGGGYTNIPAVSFSSATGQTASATATAVLSSTFTATAGNGQMILDGTGTRLGTAGTGGAPAIAVGALIDGSGVRQSLGSAYTIPANTSLVRFIQTGTVASSTVTLPTAKADGHPIQFVNYAGSITALTFSPAVNGWTNGSTLAANTGLRVRWDATASAWYREQ